MVTVDDEKMPSGSKAWQIHLAKRGTDTLKQTELGTQCTLPDIPRLVIQS